MLHGVSLFGHGAIMSWVPRADARLLRLWHRQAVELEVEISRERVPLRNAYRHVGQQAVLRVNSGEEYTLQGARCCTAANGLCRYMLQPCAPVDCTVSHTPVGSADLCQLCAMQCRRRRSRSKCSSSRCTMRAAT